MDIKVDIKKIKTDIDHIIKESIPVDCGAQYSWSLSPKSICKTYIDKDDLLYRLHTLEKFNEKIPGWVFSVINGMEERKIV